MRRKELKITQIIGVAGIIILALGILLLFMIPFQLDFEVEFKVEREITKFMILYGPIFTGLGGILYYGARIYIHRKDKA